MFYFKLFYLIFLKNCACYISGVRNLTQQLRLSPSSPLAMSSDAILAQIACPTRTTNQAAVQPEFRRRSTDTHSSDGQSSSPDSHPDQHHSRERRVVEEADEETVFHRLLEILKQSKIYFTPITNETLQVIK
jgi:hypothetical protein